MKWLNALFSKISNSKKYKRIRWYLSRQESFFGSFYDLAPVDNADVDGVYRQALDFAMQNPAVRNIALTGPYGSGKTSVIKTYDRESPYRFLNVSLATFSDPNIEAKNEVASAIAAEEITVKVERSILQQMLYGADTSTLPYSRFKRITTPRWLSFNAIGFAFWLIVCGYIYKERDNILALKNLEDIKPLWGFTCLYAFAYFAQIVSRSLKATHSLSVKKLSLQNGEVELDGTPESSILNKHLDEIIYFFEENSYDVVVFEDLDRFGSPEIFIKLREINKIINDRPRRGGQQGRLSARQPLKFIYAIKDDVFFNKDRAKFFDFITPVIPIINNFNSREMFSRCLTSEQGGGTIDTRFLSEVSLYLDDFRLIKNISNEFLVYREKVGGVPNLDKLLAMIVYKNTYPKDFEALHHGAGALYDIVGLRTQLIAEAADSVDVKIESLRKRIQESELELSSRKEELVRVFWGQLCGSNPDHNIKGIYAGSELLGFDQLLEWDNFRKLFDEQEIRVQVQIFPYGYYQARLEQETLASTFRELESKALSGESFERRHERIKDRSLLRRNQVNKEITLLKEEKAEFARKPLRELLVNADVQTDLAIESAKLADSKLLLYLVRNGFLDETYHLYISIFHEGRMSRNDWNYIQTIRDFRLVDPNAPIDNPREVVAEMRDEDFGAEYVLNIPLMDFLLSSPTVNRDRIRSAVGFISRHFAASEEFLGAYWLAGRSVELLTRSLAEHWPDYAIASIDSFQASRHVANVLAYVAPSEIASSMNTLKTLTKYLSSHAAIVYSENVPFSHGYEALGLLAVKLVNAKELDGLDDLATYVVEKSLYTLTVDNVSFALAISSRIRNSESGSGVDFRLANYTAISQAGDASMKEYVLENINTYLENVALAMESNTDEALESILEIVNHPEVDEELAVQFATRQTYEFENYEGLPAFLWGHLLLERKIAISWGNVQAYFLSEHSSAARLSEFLNKDEVVGKLTLNNIPMASEKGDDDSRALSRFLVNNVDISVANFEKLCACSPYIYQGFPADLPLDRKLVLARLGRVALNETSFSETNASDDLRAALIKRHFGTYRGLFEKCPLSIEVKIILLSSLSNENKPYLMKLISLEELQSSKDATDQAARYLATRHLDAQGYDRDLVAYCVAQCSDRRVAVDIIYNFIDALEDGEIISALASAHEPYNQFVKPSTRQKIPNTERNFSFAKALESRHIVSSIREDNEVIRINAFRKGT